MDAPANPSPWPVRRERQRHAAVVAMQKMEAWFEHLDARLSDISNQLCEAPPGLLLSTIEAVGARVSHLEAFSVCLPNAEVDHVLCEVMSRQGEVKTASTEGSADAQPELEMSPQKPLVFNIALDNAEDPPEVEDQSLRRSAPGTRRISTLELKQVPETPIDFDEWSERSVDEGLQPIASPWRLPRSGAGSRSPRCRGVGAASVRWRSGCFCPSGRGRLQRHLQCACPEFRRQRCPATVRVDRETHPCHPIANSLRRAISAIYDNDPFGCRLSAWKC